MCYVFVIISLPCLNAGSSEGLGKGAATGGIFLEAEKSLINLKKKQAGKEAGFDGYLVV